MLGSTEKVPPFVPSLMPRFGSMANDDVVACKAPPFKVMASATTPEGVAPK